MGAFPLGAWMVCSEQPSRERSSGRPDEPDLGWVELRGPFTGDFPGLAPPERTSLTPAERERALDVVTQEARIGLVAAGRPADVLAVTGWGGLDNRGNPCCR